MQKHEPEILEYTPNPEDSTYQTGPAKPHAEHRGLIAVLMILVTFLGGMASALGFLNIRLLQALNEKGNKAENVTIYIDSHHALTGNQQDEDAPSLPADGSMELNLEEGQQPSYIHPDEILQQNLSSLVTVSFSDSETVACGVIISQDGYILTNAYPIADGDPVYVTLSDGERHRASVVGIDEFTDLAVLYILQDDLTAAGFATSGSISQGDLVACVSQELNIAQGQVLALCDFLIGDQQNTVFQMDLSVSGPVYNSGGRIVGYASHALTGEESCTIIPSTVLKEVVEQIVSTGFMGGRPCLGVEVEEVQPVHQQYWQLPQGLRVTRISGEKHTLAGLQHGDIIISLGGREITSRESLCAVLRQLRTGQTVTATVIRDNREIQVELTIQASGKRE